MTRLAFAFAALVLIGSTINAAPLPKYPTTSGSGTKPYYPPAAPATEYKITELKPAEKPKVDMPAPSKKKLPETTPGASGQ